MGTRFSITNSWSIIHKSQTPQSPCNMKAYKQLGFILQNKLPQDQYGWIRRCIHWNFNIMKIQTARASIFPTIDWESVILQQQKRSRNVNGITCYMNMRNMESGFCPLGFSCYTYTPPEMGNAFACEKVIVIVNHEASPFASTTNNS